MSVRRATLAGALGQVFQVGVRLVSVPIYLRLMGVEAYGLVGIYIVFTALIQLLNFGINSTILREISRMRGGATSSATVRFELRRFLAILAAISALFALAIVALAPLIASRWLHAATISLREVVACIRLMAFAAGLNFVSMFFKGGLLGLDRQVTFNLLNSTFLGLRSLGVVAALVWIAPDPVVFCAFQLVVALAELITCATVFYGEMPPGVGPVERAAGAGRATARFAGGIAFTDLVWAAVLQVDRLVLSTALPLKMFGYFSAASVAAYGITLLVSPVIQALQPRFVELAASHREDDLVSLYYKASYGLTALVFSAAGVMIVFPQVLIYDWTGNRALAAWAASIVPLYAAANATVGVLSLPFLIQFARGNIRLHILGHVAMAVFYLPAAVWLGLHFGARGTGAAWLTMNLLYLALFVPPILAGVLPGHIVRWFTRCVFLPALIAGAICAAGAWSPLSGNRFVSLTELAGIGALSFTATLLASADYRRLVGGYLAKHRLLEYASRTRIG